MTLDPKTDSNTTNLSVLRSIWFGFVVSMFVYGGVGFVFGQTAVGGSEYPFVGTLRPLFGVVSVGLGCLSFWWRKKFVPDSAIGEIPSAASLETSPGQRVVEERLLLHITVVWALCEAVALFGLILVMLTRDAAEFVPFGIVSFALLFYHRPGAWLGGASCPLR